MYKVCVIVFSPTGDYEYGPYDVLFTDNERTTIFLINITDDNVVESTEHFRLTIDQSSLPNEITLGNTAEVTVYIYNDDCKCKCTVYMHVAC